MQEMRFLKDQNLEDIVKYAMGHTGFGPVKIIKEIMIKEVIASFVTIIYSSSSEDAICEGFYEAVKDYENSLKDHKSFASHSSGWWQPSGIKNGPLSYPIKINNLIPVTRIKSTVVV